MADEETTSPFAPSAGSAGSRLRPGQSFAGYRITSELGRGGAGIVYAAEHERLRVTRALKVLSAEAADDPAFRARFERESRLAASLEHPNAVTVYEAGENDGIVFLAMRFVDGIDLARHLTRRGSLTTDEVSTLVAQIGSALDAAHQRGLVHRDVKPANIFLEGAELDRAFLGDFGISRALGAPGGLTETGQMLGTVSFVAPEQIAGEPVDGRADVYSLACVAFQALTGEAPFDRENRLATMFAHANAPRPRLSRARPELSAAVDRVIERALAVEPDRRCGSAGEFARELGQALDSGTSTLSGLRRSIGRHRLAGAAAGALAVTIVVAAVLAITGTLDTRSDPSSPATPAAAPPRGSVSTVSLSSRPSGVAVGELNAWVASASGHSLTAIVPARDGQAGRPIAVDGDPAAVVVAFGSTWVVDRSRGTLIRLDPESGAEPVQIPVGDQPVDIAATTTDLWVANRGDGTVSRVDPESNTVKGSIHVGGSPSSITVGEGGVWVADPSSGAVIELDPGSGERVGAPITTGGAPSSIAAGEGGVWVVDKADGRLQRLGLSTQTLSPAVDVGADPTAVATGFGYVWVTLASGQVRRVDPSSLTTVGSPIEVGRAPDDIVAANGLVLVANSGESSVTRIVPGALAGG